MLLETISAIAALSSGARKINDWGCCSWTSPQYKDNQPGKLGEWGSPGSLHTGGLQVLLGDGAVRFISENIALQTYRAQATRDVGEVFAEP